MGGHFFPKILGKSTQPGPSTLAIKQTGAMPLLESLPCANQGVVIELLAHNLPSVTLAQQGPVFLSVYVG